jgi:hypothetical protein
VSKTGRTPSDAAAEIVENTLVVLVVLLFTPFGWIGLLVLGLVFGWRP